MSLVFRKHFQAAVWRHLQAALCERIVMQTHFDSRKSAHCLLFFFLSFLRAAHQSGHITFIDMRKRNRNKPSDLLSTSSSCLFLHNLQGGLVLCVCYFLDKCKYQSLRLLRCRELVQTANQNTFHV